MVVKSSPTPERRSRLRVGLNVTAQLILVGWLFLVLNGWIFSRPWRHDLNEATPLVVSNELGGWLRDVEGSVEFVIPYTLAPTERGRVEFKVLDRARRVIEELGRRNPDFRLLDFIHVAARPSDWEFLRTKHQLDLADRVYVLHRGRQVALPLSLLATIESRGSGDRWFVREDRVLSEIILGIQRVVARNPQTVGWVIPGRERPDSRRQARFIGDLARRGHTLRAIDPADPESFPAVGLVLVTPNSLDPALDFTAEAVEALTRYADGGGRLLITLPPSGDLGLGELLATRGIVPKPGLCAVPITSGRSETQGTFRLGVRSYDPDHPITRELAVGAPIWEVPYSRGLSLDPERADRLASAPGNSWIELADVALQSEVEPTEASAVAAASRIDDSRPGRVVVVGVGRAFDLEVYRQAGRRCLLNAIAWLLGDDPGRVEVTQTIASEAAETDERSLGARGWILILPVAPLILAGAVFWRRGRE